MGQWVFKQYVNESGRETFKEWIDEQPKSAKAAIHETMHQIEIRPTLRPPHVCKLSGSDDIWELKARADNKQYRPLFCIGVAANELCFLIGATKTGSSRKTKFNPISAPTTAEKRRKTILQDGRRIVEYRRT